MMAMFLAAVACPRELSNGVWFNGKIGIWSMVNTLVAQCSSKHRPKSTKVLVLATVDGERYKKLMIEDVIPAIKGHILSTEGHTIFVQQMGQNHVRGGSWRHLRRWWGTTSS
ncbi:unnamed protein product [Choristocarpus tenellus]